jgi:hypothetical protein
MLGRICAFSIAFVALRAILRSVRDAWAEQGKNVARLEGPAGTSKTR